ncbi:hypothetical protein L596_021123 [Steinernema carpocapsae]|uniref:Uncharacterized protein n=1 Tax=Steinernema carpocapsae TaxID=34508 RepID=A0A4U5MVK0_STECR|nr:hypothetical protein L596_021123 [Steinernema carpocapsae]
MNIQKQQRSLSVDSSPADRPTFVFFDHFIFPTSRLMGLLFHFRLVLTLLVLTVLVVLLIDIRRHKQRNPLVVTKFTSTAPPNTTVDSRKLVEVMDLRQARRNFEDLIDSIPTYRSKVDCENIVNLKSKRVKVAEMWNFDENLYWKRFGDFENICHEVKKTFGFIDKPLSQEEYEFPLAFSMLVHNNPVQILFSLSALYQPQNQFCLAIDAGATSEFQKQMYLLADCFPNIFVMVSRFEKRFLRGHGHRVFRRLLGSLIALIFTGEEFSRTEKMTLQLKSQKMASEVRKT